MKDYHIFVFNVLIILFSTFSLGYFYGSFTSTKKWVKGLKKIFPDFNTGGNDENRQTDH